METPTYLLGIDVGTSSVKAVLIQPDGTVLATASPEHTFETPKPLWAESNPEAWWEGTIRSVQMVLEQSGVDGKDVAAMGLTGQMHGLVLLDGSGAVLRPCIMWNDQRTAAECAEITEAIGSSEVLGITGNPVLPGFTAPKVAWVKKNEPDVYAKAEHLLLPKDYVRYRLSGELVMDVADGSGTALIEVGARTWSDRMVEASGTQASWLPQLMECAEVSAALSAEAAALLGLRAGIPIAAGAGDQAAQAVGSGIFEEGTLSATFGTSGVVFAHSKEFRVEPDGKLHAFCSAVPGQWHLMGVMLSAAGSLQWFRNNLGELEMKREQAGEGDAYSLLVERAMQAPVGSEGLFFMPYLSGERTPHPDPLARGGFVGLTLRHSKAHLIRSVIEGVTFGMRDSLELMRNLGIEPAEIVVSGGGASNPSWRQIMGDIFGARVMTVNATEGAAFGAALLAGVAGGIYSSVEASCRQTIRPSEQAEPLSSSRESYEAFYQEYVKLYPTLKDHFHRVAELNG